ncbi:MULTISPECIES: helix-turn-helix transcriptional regulator [Desulfosporosinus]|uniref:DNA-binding transcriptional regulator, XRE-family HTH domain n=1 Tax=Desulfosporosinus lacus DSM 15449 TaxID=1121420 RepID=A0A1M5QJD9_9FIRM|nr:MULTISPECIES: helix-turn-helix transcriptional regulator [Desulfosporosinus]KJR48426.1 hypothetical protein UF75_1224 [Desulfosporosinus sp. I2]SHH13910.1 DNA-binding transcriptional regulator, XRE-family HTH domain [Desulfosporosinus lacus DSM 15449]
MNKIREIADVKNMKISEIVRKTKLSKSFVYEIINENSYPTIPTGQKIARALGVTLNDVFPAERKVGGNTSA